MSLNWLSVLSHACSLPCGIVAKAVCLFKSQIYDSEYYIVRYEELEEFNEYWVSEYLSKLDYLSERFDCDDFAMLYKALAVMITKKNGFIFVVGKLYGSDGKFLGYHAWVLVITDRGWYFVEPQTGDIFPAGCKAESHDGFMYEVLWVVC